MPEVCPEAEPNQVHALFDTLRSALRLLQASHFQGDLAWRAGLIDVGRSTFQHALSFMAELPPLALSDRTLVHDQIAEFRSQSGLSEADVRGALARHA